MVFTGGLDTNSLRWVGERVQSAVNNLRKGGGFELPSSAVTVNGDESGFGSDVDGNCGSNRVTCPEIIEVELSDSDTSTEFAFSQPERNNDGAPRWPYTSNGLILLVLLCRQIWKQDPSIIRAPVLEIEYADEPSSPLRAHDTSHSSNWMVPANTNGSRKAESVFSDSSIHYASSNGSSNSPIRTSAGVKVQGSPIWSPARLPVFHASVQGTWCAVIAYDACVRVCLHAWAQSYCTEVQCFLENECALLRDAFGLQHVLLQSEDELLAERRPSQLLSTSAAPRHLKTSGKIKVQVRKVKMDSDEPPSGCSFPSPKLPRIPPSGCTPKLPRIDYGSYRRRFSSLRSDLSSGLKSTRKHYLQPRVPPNGSFSHQSLSCLEAGAKRIKQGSSFLKTRTNTLCNHSSLYEIVQETYSCFLRLTSSPEEDAIQMQPGSSETRVLFPHSNGDDLIIQVQNSKGQHCGHALVKVTAIAEPGDKIRWWPIYSSDLDDEPVGRIQLSMKYSSSPDENNNLKHGPIAETVAYDCALEVAMKVQHFQQRNLLLHGSWRWLVTEFASYYGVSKTYTNLRYLSYVMDVATPTKDCLTSVHDLLSDVKAKSTNLLSYQENCMLAKIEDQVKKTLASVFENYKSLEESALSGMVDCFRPASGTAAPALVPAVQLYALLYDILSPEAQLKLCKFFQVAAQKRLRMHCVEIDELVLTSNEGTQRDLSTSYQKMKSLILGLRNEILTDIEIHKQGILPSCIDLPTISSCIYSFNLCNRLRAFLVACPSEAYRLQLQNLLLQPQDFNRIFLCGTSSGVDAKELFHSHITMWIQDKHRHLLDQCKLDKAKWSGARTQDGTTPFVDDMHNQLKKMLDEFEIIISRWPVYTSDLENVVADVEKAIVEALDKNYGDVLSPLKDNLTNKILGFKYVHKLSRQGGNMYSVPNELGILFNSMKRMLDVLWPNIETQLMSWSSCIPDGYATGVRLQDEAAMLRTKFRSYRLAVVEKLAENTRVDGKTKLKKIIRGSKGKESVVPSRMQALEVLLLETIDHLHTVCDPTVFVELCRELWDRMGQDVLHLLEDKRKKAVSRCKCLRVAVSKLDDIFASEMQRLRGNLLKEKDLEPPQSMKEIHSML
ncbi:uncharacterized protein Pyn_10294 [Prunus yedoensis var. nudiflora]|uniref:Uncharacterized protein n=1 Tax=Prunus yedoensis var. nudiflora TaxID=2094558 RepID=A0A314XL67_PRUYE|nr:uncharacterized protein Pyn_10294 [Prunus yedoensis var. nudiflora]